MDLLLGIDMGTGSTKGVLVDSAGVVVATATVAHTMSLPRPGWAEVDAESTWWAEVCEISTRLTAEMPAGASLAAMCVSGVGPCLVLCDDALTPLRPAILYGVDTRATAEIASLTKEFGAEAILERSGTLLSSQAVGPKLEWVRRHEPRVFEAKNVPPQTTRARLRGEFIRRAQEKRRDFTVDWVHLKLNDQAQRTVLCKDPFRSVDERVKRLIASM